MSDELSWQRRRDLDAEISAGTFRRLAMQGERVEVLRLEARYAAECRDGYPTRTEERAAFDAWLDCVSARRNSAPTFQGSNMVLT